MYFIPLRAEERDDVERARGDEARQGRDWGWKIHPFPQSYIFLSSWVTAMEYTVETNGMNLRRREMDGVVQ